MIDQESINLCKDLLNTAKKYSIKIVMPLDYMVSHDTFRGPFYMVPENKLTANDYGITIGQTTQELFGGIIAESKTIFYNGLMGDNAHPETLTGVQSIFKEMAQSKGYSVIAGGDSGAAAHQLGFADTLNISTGGGALIAYLGNQKLPALQLLLH